MRVLLAVGSAPCLFDDVQAALKLYPAAELMLINGACTVPIPAEHVLAGHADKSTMFAVSRAQAFPNAPPYRMHATLSYPEQKAAFPLVTDWWGQDKVTGATSAGKAARIGLAMGYDRVVLCGCPLEPSAGYWIGEAKVPHGCPRFNTPDPRGAVLRYRKKMAVLAKQEPFKSQVFSMSGYSKQVLGAPTDADDARAGDSTLRAVLPVEGLRDGRQAQATR